MTSDLGSDAAILAHVRFQTMHTQSLAIESVAYDESARLLRMRYRDSGRTVVYEGVPQELYDLLIFSDSIGGFIREKIDGHYPVRQN